MGDMLHRREITFETVVAQSTAAQLSRGHAFTAMCSFIKKT